MKTQRILYGLLQASVCIGGALWSYNVHAQATPTLWIASYDKTVGFQVRYGAATPDAVPLGSLWKLWVYVYAQTAQHALPAYACRVGAVAASGDEYCCDHAERIDAAIALVRSCGAFFAPTRLGIHAAQWSAFWQKNQPNNPWLWNIQNMRPDYVVPLPQLLQAFAALPSATLVNTRQTLQQRYAQPRWSDVHRHLGGAYPFKTYTWQRHQRPFAGALGWLADGTVFWIGGEGKSFEVMQHSAPLLARALATTPVPPTQQTACVQVRYFSDYPIQQVWQQQGKQWQIASSGALQQHITYKIHFKNGQLLYIHSDGNASALMLRQSSTGQWHIQAQLPLEDYVARVLVREASDTPIEAAKAMSIAIRSYVQQNAPMRHGCWVIADSSKTQRVAPQPAPLNAQRLAAFTEGLVVQGAAVQYHLSNSQPTTNGTQRLSWEKAKALARQGQSYINILHSFFPQARIAPMRMASVCLPIPSVERYFTQQRAAADRFFKQHVQGFESPDSIVFCQLNYGVPYTDLNTHHIYMRPIRQLDDRVTLWHEYLHLGLRYHPSGQQETFTEYYARQFVQQLPTPNTPWRTPKPSRTYHAAQ